MLRFEVFEQLRSEHNILSEFVLSIVAVGIRISERIEIVRRIDVAEIRNDVGLIVLLVIAAVTAAAIAAVLLVIVLLSHRRTEVDTGLTDGDGTLWRIGQRAGGESFTAETTVDATVLVAMIVVRREGTLLVFVFVILFVLLAIFQCTIGEGRGQGGETKLREN